VNQGAGCGICTEPPTLGAFQGQYTDDVEPGVDAWRWRFEAGQMLFTTDPGIALDESSAIPYCGPCGNDMREERGLSLDTPLLVTLLKN
jgi:hypothetical protein